MKRIFILLAVALACISCEHAFRDELQEIHSEIDELRELINQTNSNIEALRTIINAIQDNDFVTGIAPIKENGVEVGYIISFSKSGNVTIYHGQDGQDGKPGQDGQPGKDGYTPVISARQDSDGIWYWTLDGEWMTDENGQRIKAVGTDGQPGQDGQPGKDAITPQLKIEDGYWFVSYDNGDSWHQIGKATGEDGKDGDPMFSSVDCTNSDYIVMTLSDGQTIIIPTWKAFEELQEECSKANANISAMQVIITALQDNDFVQSITPLYDGTKEVGYIISFSKSGNVTIYHGQDGQDGKPGQDGQPGKDGYTPVISARQDSDGIWYWTLDGEWMTDENGQRIKAVGTDGQPGQDGQPGKDAITPQLKIEDGYWFVSYDNGDSWHQIGKATGEDGKDGDPMFSNISITEQMITLVLADGTEIEIPRRKCFDLQLDTYGDETGALPGRQVTIKYTVANADSPVTVTASSDGRYSVSVRKDSETQGTIIIDCPLNYKDGYVNVMACDETGYTILRVINFYEEKMEFATGLEYNIAPEGGAVKIPFRSNFDYYIEVENSASSWLKTIQTRAPEFTDGEIEVSVSMNETFSSRRGKILVYPKNSMSSPYTEIIINQASAVFSLSQSKYAVKKEGDVLITEIKSTQGLTIEVVGDCEWINPEIADSEGYNYILKNTVNENKTGERRNTAINLYSGNGDIFLGMIEIVQVGSDEEDPNAMIFKVRPNYINEFIVHLPLAGNYDCYIDWGDGVIEYCLYSEKPDVIHIYESSSPASYIVKIIGKVPALNSRYVKAHSIEEVIQWGNTGLTDLRHAFYKNYLLRKIATDSSGSLSKVQSVLSAFQDCTALESIPAGLLSHCRNDLEVNNVFAGCTNLRDISEDLFIRLSETQSFIRIFDGCTSLTLIPSGLFKNAVKAQDFSHAFSKCRSLVELPESLFSNNPQIGTLEGAFHSCQSLKKVPTSIFDNNRRLSNINAIFAYCSLEGESPYTIINGFKYHLYERYLASDYFYNVNGDDAFYGDTNLTDYNSIPANWK